jgi:two-component system chemotaxis response regulator CheB
MRVVVIDDSAFMRRAITRMLTSAPDVEVIGAARNGREGVEMVQRLRPDVVTLDIEMPEMDGLTALSRIMRDCPTQVIMLSSLTTEGSHAALRALSLGAADVLAKDTSQVSLSIGKIQDELIARVRALGARSKRSPVRPTNVPTAQVPVFKPGRFDCICIGSSTGGPPVLETILAKLPSTLSTPIVVAQHMPAVFTRSMAQRLDELCQLPVKHAEDGMSLERHHIYIAPGGQNIHIHKVGVVRWELRVNNEPASAIYRPSVDALFTSAADAMQSRVLAIVLTGIGADGLAGGRILHDKGATLIAQSEETCVVYGMPKAVTQAALPVACLPPCDIAKSIMTLAAKVNTSAA